VREIESERERESESESESESENKRERARESEREREIGRKRLRERERRVGAQGAHEGKGSAREIEIPHKFQAACLAMGLFVVVRTPAANEQKAQIHSLKHELQAPGTVRLN
jgi:hypothetical protein